ncbi:MAG: hypothetical protein HGA45_19240 [Chloroflexales bacterium]|nr:hypothetical protein [Chloroflexales bacterium]
MARALPSPRPAILPPAAGVTASPFTAMGAVLNRMAGAPPDGQAALGEPAAPSVGGEPDWSALPLAQVGGRHQAFPSAAARPQSISAPQRSATLAGVASYGGSKPGEERLYRAAPPALGAQLARSPGGYGPAPAAEIAPSWHEGGWQQAQGLPAPPAAAHEYPRSSSIWPGAGRDTGLPLQRQAGERGWQAQEAYRAGPALELHQPAAAQRQPAPPEIALQRAPAETPAANTPPAGEGAGGAPAGQQPAPSIEEIIQKVYDHLRRRMVIEEERRGRSPW